jgi:hypothetical protein
MGVKRYGREADHSPPTSTRDQEYVDVYIHFPIRLHGVVLNWLGRGANLLYLFSYKRFFKKNIILKFSFG